MFFKISADIINIIKWGEMADKDPRGIQIMRYRFFFFSGIH